jgi:hypothetical protein
MLANMSKTSAVQEPDTLASAAGNGGRYGDAWLLRTMARRDPEPDQAMRRQVGCAQFHKDPAGAYVSDRAGDSFSTWVFDVDLLAD